MAARLPGRRQAKKRGAYHLESAVGVAGLRLNGSKIHPAIVGLLDSSRTFGNTVDAQLERWAQGTKRQRRLAAFIARHPDMRKAAMHLRGESPAPEGSAQ